MTSTTGTRQMQEASHDRWAGDKMAGGEKAYAIILNVLFPIVTAVTMWFCWHVSEPAKARQALLYGLITSCIILAIDLTVFVAFMSILIAVL